MERTDKLTKVAAFFIFLALAAYIGFYILNALSDTVRTALVVSDTVLDTVSVSGVVVREESVVASNAKYVSVNVSDGEKVASGEAIATALNSETALARSNRQHELELEIARAEALLSGIASADDLTGRDVAIRSAVAGLAGAVATHDLSALDSLSLALSSLIFTDGSGSVTTGQLSALKTELSGMNNSYSPDSSRIYASAAGVFSTVVDGYEYLSPDILEACTPAKLREYMQDRREEAAAIGKLVLSQTWYYAVVMPEEQAMDMKSGDRVQLDFGRYFSTLLSARVYLKALPVDGLQVVVFSCSDALTETLSLRLASADIVVAEHTGLRVPREAIYTDDEGKTFVYTMTGLQAERKDVEISFEGDGYCLVSSSGDAGALRAGNEVIITDKEISDGMVMD